MSFKVTAHTSPYNSRFFLVEILFPSDFIYFSTILSIGFRIHCEHVPGGIRCIRVQTFYIGPAAMHHPSDRGPSRRCQIRPFFIKEKRESGVYSQNWQSRCKDQRPASDARYVVWEIRDTCLDLCALLDHCLKNTSQEIKYERGGNVFARLLGWFDRKKLIALYLKMYIILITILHPAKNECIKLVFMTFHGKRKFGPRIQTF